MQGADWMGLQGGSEIPTWQGIEFTDPVMRTSPRVLFDCQSPYRMHQTYQNGWNRKGLVSDRGLRKQAWHVMRGFCAADSPAGSQR